MKPKGSWIQVPR